MKREMKMIVNAEHGSLYDRGSADSYYRRPATPHYYPNGTGHGDPITDLTESQIREYMRGYFDQEKDGDHKDYE